MPCHNVATRFSCNGPKPEKHRGFKKHFNKGVSVNNSIPKKTEKVAPKKVYKICIEFYPGGTSRIYRKDLSDLIDLTDKSVAWLKTHDFKEEDIESLGDKPDCWETYYPAPVVEPAPLVVEPESAPLVEKIAEVLAAPVVEPVTSVVEPTVDPIVQALGVPEAEVTTLTDVFVPAKDEEKK